MKQPREILRIYTRCSDYYEVRKWCDALGLYGWSMTSNFDDFFLIPKSDYVVIIYDNCKIGNTPEEIIQKIKTLSYLRWNRT